MVTKLISGDIRELLLSNGEESRANDAFDPVPVSKLFVDPRDADLAFGLCDLGHGRPELGTVRISDLEAYRGRMGLPVEIDTLFKPRLTLTAYARLAQAERAILD